MKLKTALDLAYVVANSLRDGGTPKEAWIDEFGIALVRLRAEVNRLNARISRLVTVVDGLREVAAWCAGHFLAPGKTLGWVARRVYRDN